MRAPRCPQVYKSYTHWEEWIQKYIKYKNKYLPLHFFLFETYKNSNDYLKNRSDTMLLNNWKYLTYEWLTGRKHHTLTLR